MKAAVIEELGNLSIKNVPEPKISEYQALVKIIACSICNNTDIRIIDGTLYPYLKLPGILGHESVGEVIETGAKVRYYKTGELVLRPVSIYPEEKLEKSVYPGGKLGKYHSLFGGFSELGVVTDYKAEMEDKDKKESDFTTIQLSQQSIPAYFDPIDSTMLVTFREVLDWLNRFGINNKTKLVIIGSGPVGLSMVAFSKILGAYPVIVVDIRDERLQLAKDIGADFVINSSREDTKKRVLEYSNGTGSTNTIEAVGNYNLINGSFSYLKKGGKIGIYGEAYPHKFNLEWEENAPTEWSLVTIHQYERDSHNQVVYSVAKGFVNPKNFYSHTVCLDDINYGVELLKEKKALKVVVKINC